MKLENENRYLLFVLIVVAFMAGLFFIGNHESNVFFREASIRKARIEDVLGQIPVQAKALSVYDATQGEKIYGKNDQRALPIASLAKIMTVLVALNSRAPEEMVLISRQAVNQAGSYGFLAGEKFRLGDLTKFTLIGSANDSAYALAEGVPDFLAKMNSKARKVGMENALFLNFTGLDLDDQLSTTDLASLPAEAKARAGAYASAEDVNLLAAYAFRSRPDIFSASVLPAINIKSESGSDYSVKNTNLILAKIPNILFSKTGLTPLSGGNLSVIFRGKNGRGIAVTVLGSTEEGRFSDVEKIVNTLWALEEEDLSPKSSI